MMRFGFRSGFDRSITSAVFFSLAVSSLAAPSLAAPKQLPPGLQPTEQNISDHPAHKYGETQIAVNPTDPDNLVAVYVKDSYTLACVAAGDPNCSLVNRTLRDPGAVPPAALPIGPGPVGYFFGGPRFVECGT